MRLLYEAPSLVNTLARRRVGGQLDLATRKALAGRPGRTQDVNT
ncbi:hypothetical protein [Rhodoferax ferrireducens]